VEPGRDLRRTSTLAKEVKRPEHLASDPQEKLPRAFFDSNILIYADDAATDRQKIAVDTILRFARVRSAVISTQVLGEYFDVVTRKGKVSAARARLQVDFYSRLNLVEPSLADVLGAIDLHRLHKFRYSDALVIRCAIVSGCSILFSEDMRHGQEVDGVKIVNPFL
jgi:predicted nucleic acid-binding protein